MPCSISDEEILTRLVALNRERAEEEKRGLIRWLRPEYQAPQSVQPVAKPMLEEEARPKDSETLAPATRELQPWPKDLKDQLAALRDLPLASDHLWALEEVAASFKSRGRYREGFTTQLELLSDLGIITTLGGPGSTSYHRSGIKGGVS